MYSSCNPFWIRYSESGKLNSYLKHQTSHKGDVRLACHLAYEIKAVKIFNATVVLEWVWLFFQTTTPQSPLTKLCVVRSQLHRCGCKKLITDWHGLTGSTQWILLLFLKKLIIFNPQTWKKKLYHWYRFLGYQKINHLNTYTMEYSYK